MSLSLLTLHGRLPSASVSVGVEKTNDIGGRGGVAAAAYGARGGTPSCLPSLMSLSFRQ